ncbi:hypothetical protein HanXRQr2_Chr06g0250321 [Helianthus annuus]|uniref:Uncharacterized protein n=1 Tax=Helianthus annuus TaxID=4232 RepID=A0A9K3IRR9_HELAN|nr:hypothetical protein HanXRQr2_Chr06g0250321 [Helianthus annuus]
MQTYSCLKHQVRALCFSGASLISSLTYLSVKKMQTYSKRPKRLYNILELF